MGKEGLVICLGWCKKKFLSPDRIYVRYCKDCNDRKRRLEVFDKSRVYKTAEFKEG